MGETTATIVQGRYDIVCPAKAAWDLYKAFPEAKMVWVPDAGHSALVCLSFSLAIPRDSPITVVLELTGHICRNRELSRSW